MVLFTPLTGLNPTCILLCSSSGVKPISLVLIFGFAISTSFACNCPMADDILAVLLCTSFLPSSSIEPLLTCNTAVFQYTLGYIVYNHAS